MPVAHIAVSAVSDEGDTVVVWGRPVRDPDEVEPVGFAFHARGEDADAGLAEQASRLASGDEVVIEYVPVVDGWNVARGLSFR
jgi:hypothetical protein